MAENFQLHLPDGSEHGPLDRATLDEGYAEGRIPQGALVLPDGASDWIPVEEVLGPLPLPSVLPDAGDEGAPAEDDPLSQLLDADGADTLPPEPAPRRKAGSRGSGLSTQARTILLLAGGAFLVVALLAGLVAVLLPTLSRRTAIAAVERYALADRRVGGEAMGFVVDLPAGWLALREDNPYVITRGARLRVAYPALEAFGAVQVRARPQLMGDLDRHLDTVLQERLPAQPSLGEVGRADVQLGRGRGRLVWTRWDDGGVIQQGATVVWVDGYEFYWLDAWAPFSAGAGFQDAFVELARAVAPTGAVEARVEEAADRLSVDVPELSPEALRLLIGERLSRGEDPGQVPIDALREVSRGLDALSAEEAREMGSIYDKVWAPAPEAERERLARVFALVKAGRPVAAADVRALRGAVRSGVVELPPEERARLQELSGRALEKSLLLQ